MDVTPNTNDRNSNGSSTTKIMRQPNASTIAPPAKGPTAGATAVISDATPIISPILSSGACSSTMLNISGSASPVPTPWISRPPRSQEKDGAAAASTVPKRNRSAAVRNSAFIAKRRFR